MIIRNILRNEILLRTVMHLKVNIINCTFVHNALCRGKSYLGLGNKNAHLLHVSTYTITSFSNGGFDQCNNELYFIEIV